MTTETRKNLVSCVLIGNEFLNSTCSMCWHSKGKKNAGLSFSQDPPVSFCDDPSDVVCELSAGGVVTRSHPFLDDPKAHGPRPRGLHEGLDKVPVLGLEHQRPQNPVAGLERGAEVGNVLLLPIRSGHLINSIRSCNFLRSRMCILNKVLKSSLSTTTCIISLLSVSTLRWYLQRN